MRAQRFVWLRSVRWCNLQQDLVGCKKTLDDLLHKTALCGEVVYRCNVLLLIQVPLNDISLQHPGAQLALRATNVHADRALDFLVLLIRARLDASRTIDLMRCTCRTLYSTRFPWLIEAAIRTSTSLSIVSTTSTTSTATLIASVASLIATCPTNDAGASIVGVVVALLPPPLRCLSLGSLAL